MNFRIKFWDIFFGGRQKKKEAVSFVEPALSDTLIEEKILNVLVRESEFPNVLEKDRFSGDIKRFKRILSSLGIVGRKSALLYLTHLKMRGNRYVIQDRLFAVESCNGKAYGPGAVCWYEEFRSVVSGIEKAGFSVFTQEDILLSGTAYDMLLILYVSSLSCIVGYINVVDYNCYAEYALNYCNNIFSNHEACYKSYLVGKYFSAVNNEHFCPTLGHFSAVVKNKKMEEELVVS